MSDTHSGILSFDESELFLEETLIGTH